MRSAGGTARIAVCLVLLSIAAAQDEPLRVTTRLVEVHVLVHDKSGKPVSGLTRDDFTLKDQGKIEKITFFTAESSQPPPAPPSRLPPGVISNLIRRAEPAASATIVLFDKLNTSIADQQFARRELVKFLQQADPQDRVAILSLDTSLHVVTGFGANTEGSQSALASGGRATPILDLSAVGRAGPASVDAKLTGLMKKERAMEYADERQMAELNATTRVDRTLRALEVIARHLSYLPGRKNLVWISDAFPFSMGYDSEQAMDARPLRLNFSPQVARTARVLMDANVAVYPVDAGGLTGVTMADSSVGSGLDGFQSQVEGSGIATSVTKARLSMQTLARSTGGKAFLGTNDVSGAIRQALDDSAGVYVLGFQPSHDQWDGKFHSIEIRVARDGLKTRHRRGYFAFAEEPEKHRQDSLREACWSPLDATEIGLLASVSSAEKPNQWKVVMVVDSTKITLESRDHRWSGTLDILFVQQSAEGKDLSAVQSTLPLRLTQQEFESSLDHGSRVVKHLDAAPGAVRLRIAVRDRPSGRLGTVSIPLDSGKAQPTLP